MNRGQTADIFSLFSCVSSTSSQIDQQTLSKTLRCFIIFTCNKQKTSDKAWNAGNHYKSEITVDTRTAGGT